MRDFRDAKVMARALRDALKAKTVEVTHTEALELIAKAFGYDHWNILSAKIEAADEPAASHQRTVSPPAPPQNDAARSTFFCSFCGKSQHEVRKPVAGPWASVFICDGCIDLCTEIVDKLTAGIEGGESGLERARGMSTHELAYCREGGRAAMARSHGALRYFQQWLAKWDCEGSVGDDIHLPLLPRHLVPRPPTQMTRDDLVAVQQKAQRELKRYQDALKAAVTVLHERGQ